VTLESVRILDCEPSTSDWICYILYIRAQKPASNREGPLQSPARMGYYDTRYLDRCQSL